MTHDRSRDCERWLCLRRSTRRRRYDDAAGESQLALYRTSAAAHPWHTFHTRAGDWPRLEAGAGGEVQCHCECVIASGGVEGVGAQALKQAPTDTATAVWRAILGVGTTSARHQIRRKSCYDFLASSRLRPGGLLAPPALGFGPCHNFEAHFGPLERALFPLRLEGHARLPQPTRTKPT